MGSGSFRNQANALLFKSATYQKRNICTNLCLLSAPIIFSVLLLIIQLLINNLVLTGADYECGCQCTKCCYAGNSSNCTSLVSGSCNSNNGFSCLQTNSSNCGPQFSSQAQAGFCSLPSPSNWPAMVDTPSPKYRVNPPAPATDVMVTAATPTASSSFGQYLITMLSPLVSSSNLPKLLSKISGVPSKGIPGVSATSPLSGVTYFNGYILSELGLQFGTSAKPDAQYYIPGSFLTASSTYVLVPNGTCESLNMSQTSSINLLDFLSIYGNISIANQSFPSPDGGSPVMGLSTIRVVCTDTVVSQEPSASTINQQLYCGYRQARCNGTGLSQEYTSAWDFGTSSLSSLYLNAWYNATERGSADGNQPATNFRLPGLVNMGSKAWWSSVVANLTSGSSLSDPPMDLLGVSSMPQPAFKLSLDFSSLLGPLFYCWVVQLLLPTFLQQLVYEKEKRLRMMMKMHGLGDGAYWLITYSWYMLLYIAYIIVFIAFGSAVNLQYFRKTNYGIQVIFYFLQGQCMIGFAFMLSSLFSSSLVAVVFAYLYVFASGLIGSLLLQTFMNANSSWLFFVEWIPAFSLYRGLYEMGQYCFLGVYRNQPGMQFSNLRDPGNGMIACWGIFIVEWVIFLVLGWYFEQVISSGNGIKRHPLFFLEFLWRKKDVIQVPALADHARSSSPMIIKAAGELADVIAERDRVNALTDFSGTPIVVREIQKIYPGQDGGKPKMAVQSLTLGIERGECFGLLGPNGAGKTTSINVLTGFLEPSSGSAIVEGLEISRDMQRIYKLMGVCPQHDLLWEQLTGEEHLLFYGRLKGFSREQLKESVTKGLQSVNLLNVANKQAGKYSGGMKRRLSVAISFVGSPKVVYLDEPSTGLDPASRRGLWEVVKNNKEGRALILTTHSMEEAEMLCDRLGIFVDGQLVCIGNPKEITSRYAGYLVFTITVPQDEEPKARSLVASMSASAVLTYALGGTLKYELPSSEISLSGVFEAMNRVKQEMTVLDWGVANATLEEVFIKFAKSSGIKSEA